jgi:hypothetical protein
MGWIYWIPFIIITIFVRFVVFLQRKLDIDFFEGVESHYSQYHKRQNAAYIRVIAKLLTPADAKQQQLHWIREFDNIENEWHSILFRQLYLVEERDLLKSKECLTVEESQLLHNLEEKLGQCSFQYEKTMQKNMNSHNVKPRGAWIRECEAESDVERWERHVAGCIAFGGCCIRSCDCCDKPRQGSAGQKFFECPESGFHCTIDCRCCIRWRDTTIIKKDGNEGGKENNGNGGGKESEFIVV